MTTLWLTGIPENELAALRHIRDLMRLSDLEADITDARDALATFKSDGFAFLGERLLDNDVVAQAREAAHGAGLLTRTNLDPEEYARTLRVAKLTAEGATPEQVFAVEAPGESPPAPDEDAPAPLSVQAYETALALMSMSDGNPLRAAANAHRLAATSGDGELYGEVIVALCRAFPWVIGHLTANGIVES